MTSKRNIISNVRRLFQRIFRIFYLRNDKKLYNLRSPNSKFLVVYMEINYFINSSIVNFGVSKFILFPISGLCFHRHSHVSLCQARVPKEHRKPQPIIRSNEFTYQWRNELLTIYQINLVNLYLVWF